MVGVDAAFSLSFRLLVSFQDRVGEANDVLSFVVFEQLQRCTPKKKKGQSNMSAGRGLAGRLTRTYSSHPHG